MKKSVICVLSGIFILLVIPIVFANGITGSATDGMDGATATETYNLFNRVIDNVKLFFYQGDSKVKLALDIREKELNSAIENVKNGNEEEAMKNLKRARKRLLLVQEKVSSEIADEVKLNIEDIKNKIDSEENLIEDFEVYVLEEEKTQLTAELVMEVKGKEGQILKREIVKDEATGEKKVNVIVEGEEKNNVKKDNATDETEDVIEGEATEEEIEIVVSSEESKAIELEKRIEELDGKIVKWTIKKGENNIDEAPKTKDNDVSSGPNVVDDDVAPGPQGIVGDQGYSDDEGHQGEIPDDSSGASGEIDED